MNLAIRAMFRHGYNDTTNAFKAYRRGVIDNIRPLLSNHFNLTVEIVASPETRAGDVPIYISDCSKLGRFSDWAPRRGSRQILEEIYAWLCEHERAVAAALAR